MEEEEEGRGSIERGREEGSVEVGLDARGCFKAGAVAVAEAVNDADCSLSPGIEVVVEVEVAETNEYIRLRDGTGSSGDDVTVLSRHCKYCAGSDKLPFKPL